jgi:hypothetical protein
MYGNQKSITNYQSQRHPVSRRGLRTSEADTHSPKSDQTSSGLDQI